MLLPFISDENLFAATKKVIDTVMASRNRPETQLFKNALDPFSGLFDAAIQRISIEEWLNQEKSRQVQKTFQNSIGVFHQEVIGGMVGWENLGTGRLVDVRNEKKKIIAEVKNKYNTTKGDHRARVYDELKHALSKPENNGFTGYLVEVIPKNKAKYDKLFTPPDNTTHKRRPANKKIRVISGQLFYDMASGQKNTLLQLYKVLPKLIVDITGITQSQLVKNTSLESLFSKTY